VEIKLLFSVMGGVLYLAGALPYMYLIYKRKIRPQRASWLIWLLVAVVLVINSVGTNILLFYMFQAVCCLLVFILCLRSGIGGLSKVDIASIAICVAAIVAKQSLGSGLISVVLASLVEVIAFYLSFVKLLHHPGTESIFQWIISALAGMLAFASLKQFNLQGALYPTVIVVANIVVAILILYQKQRPVTAE
jgi:hypothetical protein